MRRIYREKEYDCGDYKEIYIFPCYSDGRRCGGRKRKAKPTPEAQRKVNKKNRENKLIRLLNANFTKGDLSLDLTYEEAAHPKDDLQAKKDQQNFLRRLKRYRKKKGLSDLKYIGVIEKGAKKGRFHHHLVISGGIDIDALESMWGKGFIKASPLRFNETGLIGKGKYMVKQNLYFKSFNASKNLVHPQPHVRNGRLSHRTVEELWRDTEDRVPYERLFDGYYFAEADAYFSDEDGGYHLLIRLYRKDAKFMKRICRTG